MEGRKTIRIGESMFDDPDRGERHAAPIVSRGEKIGRNRGVDICLPDDGASRRWLA